HLTKKEKVRLIDAALKAGAAAEKPDRVCAVSGPAKHKGGRGRINEHKAKVTELAKAQGISAATARDVLAEDSKPKGKKPKPRKERPWAIPNDLYELREDVEAELRGRGVDRIHVCVWNAKQAKAMGRPAEHTLGYWGGGPCEAEANQKAFDEAVAAVMARKTDLERDGEKLKLAPTEVEDPKQVLKNILDSIS